MGPELPENVELKEGYAVFSINPKIYPLEIVYSAAYIMIDKAFIILDGNPETKIKAEVRKKNPDQDLLTLVKEFNDELLNYAVYKVQSEKNRPLREAIMNRIMLTNNPEFYGINDQPTSHPNRSDPEGILKTWEEKKKEEDEQRS